MKIKLFLFATLILTYSTCFSQDIIVLHENNIEFKVKVTEITESSVKYKKWDNLDGPVYNLNISSINRIKYKNGQEDVFNNANSQNNYTKNKANTTEDTRINNFNSINGYPKVYFVNVPYFLLGNEVIELEIGESSRRKQHSGAWGRMWVTSIPGISSNVILPKQNPMKFLIQLKDPKANPFSVCELHICEAKAIREFIDTKKGVHGEIKQEGIKLEFKKLNETGLYLITTSKKLTAGEYLFTIAEETKVYAFSIPK